MSFGKCETGRWVLFGSAEVFCLWTLPWLPFLSSRFHIVESSSLTLTEASEACRAFHVFLGSSVTSWMSHQRVRGVIFGGLVTPGEVHRCSMFSPFVDDGSRRGSLEVKASEMDFNPFTDWHLSVTLFLICSRISLDEDMMWFQRFGGTAFRRTRRQELLG